jgi:hypothetical protein
LIPPQRQGKQHSSGTAPGGDAEAQSCVLGIADRPPQDKKIFTGQSSITAFVICKNVLLPQVVRQLKIFCILRERYQTEKICIDLSMITVSYNIEPKSAGE